jgi:alpha-glucosidase (family GH31 glycosyl hydrolase)
MSPDVAPPFSIPDAAIASIQLYHLPHMKQIAGYGLACHRASQEPHHLKSILPARLALQPIVLSVLLATQCLVAASPVIVGSVRVQCLSDSLARLEVMGPAGFEDRETFHVVNRNWPGTAWTSNLVSGEVRISTTNYVVRVPLGATSLSGVSITTPAGQMLFQGGGDLSNSVWLPGPSDNPASWSFADTPRLIPPAWGLTPAPVGAPNAATSGWVTNNDAADVYVFVPGGSYAQLRRDFLKLTGPTEMVPLYAFGGWDSRYYNYSETTALQEIEANRSRRLPQDVMVIDTGWRVNASIGYEPNAELFPDMPRFFAEAHARNTRVVFNDHPEPEGDSALDPLEVTYRYTNLVGLINQGLDVWWYDRNWSASIFSPAANLRREVWGMKIYHDTAVRTKPMLRPLIMANVDGIDNGIRNRPPNVAAHRYSIQWTGDTYADLNYLNYGVQNAVHAGIHWAYPYLSEDLGGHNGATVPGDYLRWIQFGALSPIYRPHCTMGLTRMPWTFGAQAEWVARRYLNLRYRLLPVFYAAAHENYETGEPILRRLDLDYPRYPEASQNSQYLITHSLLVAPVVSGGLATVPASWLSQTNGQPGLQADYFNNETLAGSPTLNRTDANIDFNWGTGSPGGSVTVDNFTVRWTGNITIPAVVGDVILAATSDDGVRVWVDNQLCIDNWGPNDSVPTEAIVAIKAGQSHQLRVEFLELAGNAIMSLKWRPLTTAQTVWIPPGNWINAWNGAVLTGPMTDIYQAPLDQIPLYVRSGSIFAHAPEMQHTEERPWDVVTLDTYPSSTETGRTTLYEDDKLSTAYKQGQFRTTSIQTWADHSTKSVSVSIDPAVGTYAGAISQRAWNIRFRRPPGWSTDLTPMLVTVNGQAVGPIVRRIKNATTMPLGSDVGAPDADVFDVQLPAGSVLASNLVVATFASDAHTWTSQDVGNVGAEGNAFDGGASLSNAVYVLRGSGTGLGSTNDGFQFLHRPVVGNVQLTTRLLSQQSASPNAVAGIMISEGLSRSARRAVVALRPGNTGIIQSRSTNGAAAQTTVTGGMSSPRWLRLVRSGNNFSGYASSDGTTWSVLGNAAIAGFSSNAYIGLIASAGIDDASHIAGTNRFGTVILGASAGLDGGVFAADDTNCNVAVFGNLSFNTPIKLSAVPHQTLKAGATSLAIPLVVTSSNAGPITLTAQSSQPGVLPVANIQFAGAGAERTMTLVATLASGASTVTLTASDGVSSASCEFTVTVLPLSGVLLQESFSGYSTGNMGGQAFRGSGFASGSWMGLNSSFGSGSTDAAQFSTASLTTSVLPTSGGKIAVKGDGSNLRGWPDLSASGPFAAVGLVDTASGLIGGDTVNGTLYLSFLLRATATNHNSEYGGLHLSRGTDSTGVLIGNAWRALAFSLDYTPSSTEVDLRNNNGVGDYLFLDNTVHLVTAKIVYRAGAADTISVWLDPDPTKAETSQNAAATYVGSVSGDLSFDRFFFRGGNNHPFEFDELSFGTSWSSVFPGVQVQLPLPPPKFADVPYWSGNNFGFLISGETGQPYSILSCTNLSTPVWRVVNTGLFGFNPVPFQAAMTGAQKFYRISIP